MLKRGIPAADLDSVSFQDTCWAYPAAMPSPSALPVASPLALPLTSTTRNTTLPPTPQRPDTPARLVRFTESLVDAVTLFRVSTPQTRQYRPYSEGGSTKAPSNRTRAEPSAAAAAVVRRWASKYRPSRSQCYGEFKGRYGDYKDDVVHIQPPSQPELAPDPPQEEMPERECTACTMGLQGLYGDPDTLDLYHTCWRNPCNTLMCPPPGVHGESQPEPSPNLPYHLTSPLSSPSGEEMGGTHAGASSVFEHGTGVSRRPT